jgi:hypothetical protein
LQGVAKITELDEYSSSSSEQLLVSDSFSELLDSAFFLDELDRLSTPSSLNKREDEDKVTEPAEVTELEDELPSSSMLLNVVGSLFSADAESSHATKNATMLNTTKIFFIKTPSPQRLHFPGGQYNLFYPK